MQAVFLDALSTVAILRLDSRGWEGSCVLTPLPSSSVWGTENSQHCFLMIPASQGQSLFLGEDLLTCYVAMGQAWAKHHHSSLLRPHGHSVRVGHRKVTFAAHCHRAQTLGPAILDHQDTVAASQGHTL